MPKPPPPRNNELDVFVQPEQLKDALAAGVIDEPDRGLGQPGLGQGPVDQRNQSPIGVQGLASAPQDDRISALDGQRGDVDRHIRAGLVASTLLIISRIMPTKRS